MGRGWGELRGEAWGKWEGVSGEGVNGEGVSEEFKWVSDCVWDMCYTRLG